MSQAEMISYVQNRIKVYCAANHPTLKIAYMNQRFVQPDNEMFARVMLNEGPGFFANLGSRKIDRHTGVLEFVVYVPTDNGSKNAVALAESVATQFRNLAATLPDNARMVFRLPSVENHGYSGNLMGFCMRVEYYRDEYPQ